MKKINITIFTGGSGNKELINIIKDISWIKLDLITNCYDDGKSTGRLRELIPGMLGPSDIRKNISNLLNENEIELKKILNLRIEKISFKEAYFQFNKKKGLVFNILNNLPKSKSDIIYFYLEKSLKKLSYLNSIEKEISIGNMIFSGIYLIEKDFNKSVYIFSEIFNKKECVHNITDGKNLFLNALRDNAEIIINEGDLVSKIGNKIKNLFLLKKKINDKEIKLLKKKTFKYKNDFFEKRNIYPNINNKINNIIKKSDIIIYGPGTQFSSLFPSYLTKNLFKKIQDSPAKKIFIGNIFYDFDIANEDIESITNNFFYYISSKNKNAIQKNKIIDYYFINKYDSDDLNINLKKNYIKFKESSFSKKFKFLDWEKNLGIHYPGLLLKEILRLNKNKWYLQNLKKLYTITFIIPCLNEENTILKTLNDLNKIELSEFNLNKEIIVVDGGSKDNSLNIIKKFGFCKLFSLLDAGKGDCIKFGISKSRGDIVCFYPADNEYDPRDLKNVIRQIIKNNNKVVYGSRLIKMIDLSSKILKIYNNNYFNYLFSKYGGLLLSVTCLLLYNRYISDPLTSIKAFNGSILRKLKLKSKGFDIDLEITANILTTKNFILEIPVSYYPRSKMKGKKITIYEGFKCILRLILFKFSNVKK
jgi:2-phospho-L-lactate transferase/gluconeogenesis factor (CofD/UPF0052 family)